MKRYTLHIVLTLLTMLMASGVEGQSLPTNGTISGSYTLTNNITTVGALIVEEGTHATINLNGKNITRGGAGNKKFIFSIPANSTLTIKGNGIISGGSGDRGGCAIIRGTLNLEGGTIRDCISTDDNYNVESADIHIPTQGCGGAFYVEGVFNMYGGTIENCRTDRLDGNYGRGGAVFIDAEKEGQTGTFNMSGGTIKGCSASWGGAVYVHKAIKPNDDGSFNKGVFNMTGGSIINNASKNKEGGAVYNDGSFTMSGGTINSNSSTTDGGGVFNANSFEMSDGIIELNTSTLQGGGVYNESSFTMSGGTIKSNTSTLQGGGVYNESSFTMSGGTIKSNTSTLQGGGVYNESSFTMLGGSIEYNTSKHHGGGVYNEGPFTKNEIDYPSGTFIISGGRIYGNEAGIINGSEIHGPGIYTKGNVEIKDNALIQANKPKGWQLEIRSDDGLPKCQKVSGGYGGGLYADGSHAIVKMSGGTISDNLAGSGGGVMLWKGAKMTMTGGQISHNYAIGKPSVGNGGAMYIQKSTFDFEGGTLSNNIANRYGGAINLNDNAVLNLKGNCLIHGNKASHGGAISQEAGECQLTLENEGIQIYENQAHGKTSNYVNNQWVVVENGGNGGGLFIEKGTVTISAGKISNNTASGHGGGASLYVKRIHGRKTTVNISGGEISGNTAEFGGGIDLYADFQSLVDSSDVKDVYTGKSELVVNFENGTLKENKATQNGAGIYVSFNEKFSTAQMTIGTSSSTPIVENNIAQNNGGGFGMSNNGEIRVKNVSASGNQAMNGGAVWLGSGNFTMHKGTFSNNKVSVNGGGIYLGGGTFMVPSECNAIFKNNEAGKEGGGLYCAATFTINGTIAIQGNKAKNGAGVSVNGGSVTLSDGIIENNIAEQYGGGLYVIGDEVASFQGGTFTKNKAQAGGGICAIGKINLTLASNVNENTAVNGGGIYMADGVDMSFGQGIIKANKAESSASIISAKEGTNETVSGVGGGIFMANNTSLEFTKTSSLGIYGNAASNAAADIFANGNNTKIVLPNTKGMDLTGFDVPGNELYWVEDYVTGETVNGKTASRYEDALKDSSLPIVKIDFDNNDSSKTISDYICLDLGYDLVFVTLKALGLLNEDQAKIDLFYRVKDNSTDVARYTGVLFTGIANNGEVVREIGLPSGDWQFKPSDWFSERYGNVMEVSPSPYANGFIKVTREGLNIGQTGATVDKTITFTFDPKEDNIKYDNIIESHHRVVNYMGTGIK